MASVQPLMRGRCGARLESQQVARRVRVEEHGGAPTGLGQSPVNQKLAGRTF
jgi:hypothetical protein